MLLSLLLLAAPAAAACTTASEDAGVLVDGDGVMRVCAPALGRVHVEGQLTVGPGEMDVMAEVAALRAELAVLKVNRVLPPPPPQKKKKSARDRERERERE